MSGGFSPSQFPFVGGQPGQCWAGVPDSHVMVTIENTDPANDIFFGYSNSIQVGGSNTGDIPPLTSAVVDGSRTVYLVGPDGTSPANILPGVTQVSASPVALATALVASGIAQLIAQSIAQSGLPLIGPPVILYNVSSVPPATGSGLVGFTIPNQALQPTCYDAGKSQSAADSQMVGILGRGSPAGHPTFTKKFWNPSNFNTGLNDMANYAAFGTKVATCLKPAVFQGLPANTDFKTTGLLTPSQNAQAQADYNAIGTFYAALLGMGFTTATLTSVLFQEPEVKSNSINPTDYQNIIFTYGPAVNATGVPLVLDIGSGGGVTTGQAFCNAGLAGAAAAGVTVGALAQDLYLPTWRRGNVTLDMIGSIADAQVPKLPFGVYEFGCAPNNFPGTGVQDSIDFLLGKHASGGNYGILDYMQHRLQNNLVNADSEYYMGQCSPTGAGDLTSPIGLDPTQGLTHDFRIGLYQQIFDTLTAVPSTALTIAPGTTTTITPTNPSPVGNLATVDELSYELSLGISAGAASTNPFIALTLTWFDFDQLPRNQNPVAREIWHIPMGANADANGPLVVYGGGRMHGQYLQVKINNQDSVACTVQFMTLAGSSRIGARSSLTWYPAASSSPQVPTFTLAQCADQSLQIGRISGFNMNAGATADFLCGLYAGDVSIRIYQSGAAGNGTVTFTLQVQPTGVFGTTNLLNEVVGNNSPELLMQMGLPRGPCKMHIKNNDANAVLVDFEIIARETS